MDGYQKRTEAKRLRILDAARELFGRHGFRKVNVDEIADLAEVSKVSIYTYFKSKAGLVEALVHQTFNDRKKSIEALIRSDAPFDRKLQALILQKADASGSYSREFLEQALAHPAWKKQPVAEIQALMFEFFDQGRREGQIDPAIANDVLMAYIEVFKAGTEAAADRLAALGAEELQQIISMFFRGITAG